MANPSPQHTPTDGLGTPNFITLTAAAEALTTIVAGREYSVTLSLSSTGHTAATTLTAVLKDIGGNTFTSGNGNTVSFKSYNTAQATVNVSTGVITSVAVGQALIEASFPTFDTTNAVTTDKVYVQVLVNVVV
jgi:hypothetical protein